MNTMPKPEAEPIGAKELRQILSAHPTFASLSHKAFEALAAIADRVFIPGGTLITRSGEAIADAFIVEYGAIRLKVRDRFALEGGRGETIGILSVLTQKPFVGDCFALRDTKLIRLRGSDLLQVLAANPELIVALSRYADDAIKRSLGMRASQYRPRAFAVLPVREDPRMRDAADSLFQALEGVAGPGCLIDSHRLREICGGDVSEPQAFEKARERLINWCEAREAHGHFLMFICDPAETSWTRWCVKQTDRIVVIAGAEGTDQIERINRKFVGRRVAGSALEVDLLLIQNPRTEQPRGTGAWIALACLRRLHHVRPGNTADFKRAARRMSERAIGVVLGGGGARGIAHLGVLQALDEAGIPIDAISGTSMGAVMAACYAKGWSPKQILDLASRFIASSRALMDLDFPMVAFLRGRKLDNILKRLFGTMDIMDLWLPHYCISSSLSKGQMMLHDRGPVWLSLRASCSYPGVFPPVHADGQLLVDGGIVDNLPMEIMATQCRGGTVIAVDVGGGGAADLMFGEPKEKSGWKLLRDRLNPSASRKRFANIFQILVWSTTMSSKKSMQQIVQNNRVDLFLTPPVQAFQVIGFDAHEKLFAIGYAYAREQLAAWEGLAQIAGPKT